MNVINCVVLYRKSEWPPWAMQNLIMKIINNEKVILANMWELLGGKTTK
jgi:hypothetical protein